MLSSSTFCALVTSQIDKYSSHATRRWVAMAIFACNPFITVYFPYIGNGTSAHQHVCDINDKLIMVLDIPAGKILNIDKLVFEVTAFRCRRRQTPTFQLLKKTPDTAEIVPDYCAAYCVRAISLRKVRSIAASCHPDDVYTRAAFTTREFARLHRSESSNFACSIASVLKFTIGCWEIIIRVCTPGSARNFAAAKFSSE